MARKPKLAIYDETEAGIEESMLIISHQERIMKIADEIAVIADGTLKKIGKRDEVLPTLLEQFDNACSFR